MNKIIYMLLLMIFFFWLESTLNDIVLTSWVFFSWKTLQYNVFLFVIPSCKYEEVDELIFNRTVIYKDELENGILI